MALPSCRPPGRRPCPQISSYIFDVVRAAVTKLNLDDVFIQKEDIARV